MFSSSNEWQYISDKNMSAARQGTRSGNRVNYSCDQCRSRKLRCDRPVPCANCVSRGIECVFSPSTVVTRRRRTRGLAAAKDNGSSTEGAPATPPVPPSPSLVRHAAAPDQTDLLAEIQALKRMAQDLESRVMSASNGGLSMSPTTTVTTTSPASSSLGKVSDAVAHLERVSMSQHSRDPSCFDDVTFQIARIQDIPCSATHTMHMGHWTRCVYLPEHHEARILADKFVSKLSYVYHVLHNPSLPTFIDETYHQLSRSSGGQGQVQLGHVILLLSIIASASQVWTADDCAHGGEAPLFSSPAEANLQTSHWIKATHDVLAAQQNCPPPTLETVLGITVFSYLMFNQEGASLRFRSLVSMGIVLGQEIGLHRMDGGPGRHEIPDTIRSELGRRAWWYLVATDWVTVSRYVGPREGIYLVSPRQMAVNKPRNIDDADLLDGGPNVDLPYSQPTDMSYFLQRLRLAEVSRSIMEPISMATMASGTHSYLSHVMNLDSELERMIREVPPFLNLDSYHACPDAEQGEVFIQAYLLNVLIQSQRCVLHLRHVTSRFTDNDPADKSSREACVHAARRIIRAEQQLENTRHPFVQTRMRLSVILHGVFMASIVILMDACLEGTGRRESDEVAEVLRIVGEAEPHSLAAGKLHEALVQLLARHGGEQYNREESTTADSGPSEAVLVSDEPSTPFTTGQTSHDDQLAQSLEELVDMEGFEWDDLFSTLDSSSFF